MKVNVIAQHLGEGAFPTFAKGTAVTMGEECTHFLYWYPCEIEGYDTYVPKAFVCNGKLIRDYNPTELDAKVGDVLEVQEIVNAWLIATNENGITGWVPAESVVSVGILTKQIEIETKRLLLRRWQDADIDAFTCMNADTTVMRFFPATLSADETKAFYDSIQQEFSEYGYGLYAVEEKDSGCFIGYIGFHWARFDMDFCPCIEIGWRIDKKYWNKGYATEGAAACLKHGFDNLGFDEVVSFTATENIASKRVMQKIGMHFERYFEHPKVAEGHPLRPHVFYRIKKNDNIMLY